MLPIAGKPALEHLLLAIRDAGIREIVLLVGHKRELINAYFEDGSSLGLNLTYVVQSKIIGTASALREAESFMKGDDFLLAYGDLFVSRATIKEFVDATSGESWSMATVRVQDASRFGLVEIEKGFVKRIHEKPPARKAMHGYINSGIYRLNPGIFELAHRVPRSKRGEYELTDSLQDLVAKGEKVRVFEISSSNWLDIGQPWDLLEANERALGSAERRVEGSLEQNVVVDGKLIVEKGAVVKAGTRIQGPVFIGGDAKVGPNSRLRAHTAIGRKCVVGSSCEIKNSIIMDATEIPHLSYVGDSVIGERCNLGAGTITANLRFDDQPVRVRIKNQSESSARRKLGAIIGDEVKTGVNVSIYPGVKIGSASWIEPGAVVRKDVPPFSYVAVRQSQTVTKRRATAAAGK